MFDLNLIVSTLWFALFVAAMIGGFFVILHRGRGGRARRKIGQHQPERTLRARQGAHRAEPLLRYLCRGGGLACLNPGGVTKMFGNVQGRAGHRPQYSRIRGRLFSSSGGEIVSVEFVPRGPIPVAAPADVDQFMINNTVRLIIGAGNFFYCDAPMEYWAGGARAYGGNVCCSDQRDTRPAGYRSLSMSIRFLLTDGVNFRAEINGTTFVAAANFTLRVYLDGQKTQPAQ